jgi:hypothetical protein
VALECREKAAAFDRRMPIADLRTSKVRTVLPALSFDIPRFDVLRPTKKTVIFKPAEEEHCHEHTVIAALTPGGG